MAWAVLASVASLEPPAFFALLEAHGSARAVLEAAARGPRHLAAAGSITLTLELPERLREAARREGDLRDTIRRLGLAVITVDDPGYPSRLRWIDLAPPVLFVSGDGEVLEAERSVAVVGTRRPSEAGRLTSARIGGALARERVVVVSGLAVGIDGAAHAAVLAEHGRTIAVIAGGHDRIYPSAHQRLARDVVESGGAIVSEMAPGTPHLGAYFIRRNRIIAGLADATVVVEAPARSGALSTARWALGHGRLCFLIPGAIDDPRSAGCLALLRDYAPITNIATGVGELLEDLELFDLRSRTQRRSRARRTAVAVADLGQTEAAVARALLAGRTTTDEIAAVTGLPVATILGSLTMLELRGLVSGVYGRYRLEGRLAAGT